MLSIFRWGSSSNNEQNLTEKSRMQEEASQKQSQHEMTPGNVKRKRGKSTQSISRPAKRNPKPSKDAKVSKTAPAAHAVDDLEEVQEDDGPAQGDVMDWGNIVNQPGADDVKNDDNDSSTEEHAKLKEAISRQFNLEILLKHNELRLIDQEIAKIQIALEQLRRCSVIPYPSMTSEAQDMLNVAHAKGIPAPTANEQYPAAQPAPWGVVDGPYSRHYAKWLLPDPTFDGGPTEPIKVVAKAGKTIPDRHTRCGKEISLPMTKPRARAGIARYQALGATGGEHKDTKGPMILKRNLDGKLVKLVCIHCHREDFNSAQGFINHCRIAHSHNLASHEAAARECGQEVDPNGVIETAPETSTPVVGVQTSAVAGLVHPMNKPQMPHVPKLSLPQPKRSNRSSTSTSTSTSTSKPSSTQLNTGGPFRPSNHVPHLSRLFAKMGKSVDLTAAFEDATTKDEIEDDNDTEGAPSGETDSDEETTPTAPGMARIPSRVSHRGGPALSIGTSRPKSQKGPENGIRRPYTNQAKSTRITLPERGDINDLSPNTIASVNAPSLISDSDDASSENEYESNDHDESSSDDDSEEEDAALDDKDIDVDMNHELPLRDRFSGDHTGSSGADPELRASSKARSHHTSTGSNGHRKQTNSTTRSQRRRGRTREG